MANVTTLLESIGSKFKLGVAKAIAIEKGIVDFEAKALPVEREIATAVTLVDPEIGTTLQELVSVLGGVEQVATAVGASTGTGLNKLQAAVPGIESAIFSDPLFAGKKPQDLNKFNTAVEKFAGALADIANSFAGAIDPAKQVQAPVVPVQSIPVSA